MCHDSSILEVVLAHLIFQLLEKRPGVVRRADDWKDIESSISSRSDRQEGLTAALLRIIDLQKEPVFIILDRPELNEDEDVAEYIRTMVRLARETKGELKVLIVQRSELWDFEENRYGIMPKGVDQKLLQTVRLDQRRIR